MTYGVTTALFQTASGFWETDNYISLGVSIDTVSGIVRRFFKIGEPFAMYACPWNFFTFQITSDTTC